jgi:polyisoprenoid-binding protein YceI
MDARRAAAQILTSALLVWPAAGRQVSAAETFAIDPAASQVTIDVGKAGVLSFAAGHTHQVVGPIESGTVVFDREDPTRSRVHIIIATAALKVAGQGEPPGDVPKVQAAMDSDKVLDVARYPRIVFESTSAAPSKPSTAPSSPPSHARSAPPASAARDLQSANALNLTIEGRLTIRDVTRSVSVPVQVELAGESLTTTGRFSVRQTAYRITPISVAGVVTVKDALDIRFRIVAHRR